MPPSITTPQLVELSEQPMACIPLVVPRAQIQDVMGPTIRELYAELQAQGIAPAGPWFTHHLRRPNEVFDFEVCIPVAQPFAAHGRARPGTLRATRAAHATWRGPYEGLAGAWGELATWLEANGHSRSADLWEVYAAGPESSNDPAEWRTELYQPIED